MQTITRKGSFDACHRVMNEKFKCFNVHGHTYLYELTFKFETMEKIGYAVDFKEIKRVMMQWIDDLLDHAAILNPCDHVMLEACRSIKSKFWVMTLNGMGYCNPTVENIAREIYIAMVILCREFPIKIQSIRLWETPNCFTDCDADSISRSEIENFSIFNGDTILMYAKEKGQLNYSDKK